MWTGLLVSCRTAIDPAVGSLQVAQRKPGADRVRWLHGDATVLPALQADLVTSSRASSRRWTRSAISTSARQGSVSDSPRSPTARSPCGCYAAPRAHAWQAGRRASRCRSRRRRRSQQRIRRRRHRDRTGLGPADRRSPRAAGLRRSHHARHEPCGHSSKPDGDLTPHDRQPRHHQQPRRSASSACLGGGTPRKRPPCISAAMRASSEKRTDHRA